MARRARSIPILPSRVTVEGLDRAPHRAFLRALGVAGADLAKPFVGVASTDRDGDVSVTSYRHVRSPSGLGFARP